MSDLEHCHVCRQGLKPWDNIVSVNRWDTSSGLCHEACDPEYIARAERKRNKPDSWLERIIRKIAL